MLDKILNSQNDWKIVKVLAKDKLYIDQYVSRGNPHG